MFERANTVLGDGRQWDEVLFNRFPSHAVFDRLRSNATHQGGQATRRSALEDTYTLMLAPSIDRLAAATRENRQEGEQEQEVKVDQIPVAHTPAGGWRGAMPPPVLDGCDDPLAPGAPDFRGLWQAFEVLIDGAPEPDASHRERIEQAGNRVVITAGGVVHDMRADGTLENGVNDVSARGFSPISVAARFEDGALVLRPNDTFVAVTRHLEGDVLVWNVLPLKRVTRMRRVSPS